MGRFQRQIDYTSSRGNLQAERETLAMGLAARPVGCSRPPGPIPQGSLRHAMRDCSRAATRMAPSQAGLCAMHDILVLRCCVLDNRQHWIIIAHPHTAAHVKHVIDPSVLEQWGVLTNTTFFLACVESRT